MDTNRLQQLSIIALMVSTLSGCYSIHTEKPGAKEFAPIKPLTIEQIQAQSTVPSASLYTQGISQSLWQDQRARNVGDIITVLLDERTLSSKSSGTDIKKEDSIDMSVNPLMGANPNFHLDAISSQTLNLDTTAENNREFGAESNADQSNMLVGSISVTVHEVWPNGLLLVKGEKWMTFAQGDEFIRIEGLIRAKDVDPDNQILSAKIADARITYSASGALAEAHEQGWLSRFFSSPLWPF